jgi:hypothetical protein
MIGSGEEASDARGWRKKDGGGVPHSASIFYFFHVSNFYVIFTNFIDAEFMQ